MGHGPTNNKPQPTPTTPPWKAPDVQGKGNQFSVHTVKLDEAATKITNDVQTLDGYITQLQVAGPGTASLNAWPTGSSFHNHATQVSNAIVSHGKNHSAQQTTAATNLKHNSQSYSDAESANKAQIGKVHGDVRQLLNTIGGSVNAGASTHAGATAAAAAKKARP